MTVRNSGAAKNGTLPQALANRVVWSEGMYLRPQHFQQLERYVAIDDTLCVHAGVNPLRSLEEQDEEDLFWIRQEFITPPHSLPYTVMFGHTPQREVFLDLPYKVGLDTGLVYGGKLSCLEVTEKKLLQVRKGIRRVEVIDVASYWKKRDLRLTPASSLTAER